MALPRWVENAKRRSMLITWYLDGTATPEDLTGATMTGTMRPQYGETVRAIVGDLTVTDGPGGVFRWDFDDADVVEGDYVVQFNADYGDDPTPAKTFRTTWSIEPELAVTP